MCAMTTKASAITVDDLVGEYKESISGYDWWNNESWVDINQTDIVTISKVDDTTITLTNLYDWGTDLTGVVDFDAMTITFTDQMLNQWYTFCGYPWDDNNNFSSTNPVIATIKDDGTIELDWALTYGTTCYVIAYSVLTRPQWTMTGQYDAGELASGEATLLAFADGSYGLNNFLPYHYVFFTVNESNQIEVIGGSGDDDENGGDYKWFYYIKEWAEDYSDYDCMWLGYGEGSKFEGTEESGVINLNYGYYKSLSSENEDATGTYTFTWETPETPDTPDGISGVKAPVVNSSAVYSLSGQKVGRLGENLSKGVYISNGKKFVVK